MASPVGPGRFGMILSRDAWHTRDAITEGLCRRSDTLHGMVEPATAHVAVKPTHGRIDPVEVYVDGRRNRFGYLAFRQECTLGREYAYVGSSGRS